MDAVCRYSIILSHLLWRSDAPQTFCSSLWALNFKPAGVGPTSSLGLLHCLDSSTPKTSSGTPSYHVGLLDLSAVSWVKVPSAVLGALDSAAESRCTSGEEMTCGFAFGFFATTVSIGGPAGFCLCFCFCFCLDPPDEDVAGVEDCEYAVRRTTGRLVTYDSLPGSLIVMTGY